MSTTLVTNPLRKVLSRLQGVKEHNGKYSAKCPAHADGTASLSIARSDTGNVLVHCHAGCTHADICAAIDLKTRDLFPPRKSGRNGKHNGNGTANEKPRAQIVATDPYLADDGTIIAEKVRLQPKSFYWRRPDGYGGYINNRDALAIPLFNAPALFEAREGGADSQILLVEGEKDANRANSEGFIGTTSPDGASKDTQRPKWRSDFNEQTHGLRVAVICDNDGPGLAHGENAANEVSRTAREVKLIRVLPGVEHFAGGDLSDYFDNGGTGESLRALIDATPIWTPGNQATAETSKDSDTFAPVALGNIWLSDPEMREEIVDGLLRRGEVGNIISTSKSFKTYLVLGLAICMALGRQWLDRFACRAGPVLLIDLELSKASITKRTQDIARAMHIDPASIAESIQVLSLRGKPATIDDIERIILSMPSRSFSAVIVDPLYKTYPEHFDENGNAQMTALYRRWERMSEHLDGALFIVHHGTKGSQSDKRVVDVGAGASAPSRSADCHIALREHEQDDAIVFDARVRSFPPVAPMVLRWQYPIWQRDLGLNPADLKAGNRRTRIAPDAGEPWTVTRFVEKFITLEPKGKESIEIEAEEVDLSGRKAAKFLKAAVEAGKVHEWTYPDDKRRKGYSTEPQPLIGGTQ